MGERIPPRILNLRDERFFLDNRRRARRLRFVFRISNLRVYLFWLTDEVGMCVAVFSCPHVDASFQKLDFI
jgi:hypothetical protein